MKNNDIDNLKELVDSGETVYWMPDSGVNREVVRVGEPPKEDVPEPSYCAYFGKGEYVALWNCEIQDFAVIKRLESSSDES